MFFKAHMNSRELFLLKIINSIVNNKKETIKMKWTLQQIIVL